MVFQLYYNCVHVLTRCVFYLFYRYHSHKLRASEYITPETLIGASTLCSFSPFIGNFAFPDYSAIYFMSFLPPNKTVTWENDVIPLMLSRTDHTWIPRYNLFSITFYNTAGEIIDFYDDKKRIVPYVGHTTTQYCAVIIRVYSTDPKQHFSGFYEKYQLQDLMNNTHNISAAYKWLVSRRKIHFDDSITQFRFSKQPISMFFPNPRARYLVLPLKTIHQTIIIEGKQPVCGLNKYIRYFGFMACNLRTTQTDDCLSYFDLPDNYVIFVSSSMTEALSAGYNPQNPHHKCMFWMSSNEHPVVVYREIRVDNGGLFSLPVDTALPSEIEYVLGEHYPRIYYK